MTTRRNLMAAAAAALAVTAPAGAALAQRAPRRPARDWRDGLDDWLEAQRAAWGVPGMAVAIIRDGAVGYMAAFGEKRAGGGDRVTTGTLFRGASTTKALTAASLALLVDEGRMAWDAPAGTWLPGFALAGGEAHGSVSVRDMLSHRTGLPAHDLLWYANATDTRADLVRRLRHLSVIAPPRHRYHYTNLMVAVAGAALESVTGDSWEAFVRARLFAPLGMDRAVLSAPEMAADPDHAIGHDLGDTGPARPLVLRHDLMLGPAGAMNASISAYARWVLMQVSQGRIEGRRILSPAAMAAMWEPLILTAETPDTPATDRTWYGLGWRIDRYRDRLRVAHGGDLNGFTSRVVMLPREGIGLAILTNAGSHPLPNTITPDLLDRLLGLEDEGHAARALERRRREAEDAVLSAAVNEAAIAAGEAVGAVAPEPDPPPSGAAEARPAADYAGTFVDPGYGAWRVRVAGDAGLRAGFNAMEGRLVHYRHDLFDLDVAERHHGDFNGLRLNFQTGDSGLIVALNVRMESDAPPVRFARA